MWIMTHEQSFAKDEPFLEILGNFVESVTTPFPTEAAFFRYFSSLVSKRLVHSASTLVIHSLNGSRGDADVEISEADNSGGSADNETETNGILTSLASSMDETSMKNVDYSSDNSDNTSDISESSPNELSALNKPRSKSGSALGSNKLNPANKQRSTSDVSAATYSTLNNIKNDNSLPDTTNNSPDNPNNAASSATTTSGIVIGGRGGAFSRSSSTSNMGTSLAINLSLIKTKSAKAGSSAGNLLTLANNGNGNGNSSGGEKSSTLSLKKKNRSRGNSDDHGGDLQKALTPPPFTPGTNSSSCACYRISLLASIALSLTSKI